MFDDTKIESFPSYELFGDRIQRNIEKAFPNLNQAEVLRDCCIVLSLIDRRLPTMLEYYGSSYLVFAVTLYNKLTNTSTFTYNVLADKFYVLNSYGNVEEIKDASKGAIYAVSDQIGFMFKQYAEQF